VIVNKRLVFNLFKYALAFGLLGWVVYTNWAPANGRGLQEVWQKHVIEGQPIHIGFLALGFVIFLAALLMTLVRWYVLVRAQDLPFTLPGAMRIGLVGFFWNTFLPGSVGGDVIKAAALAREQSRRTVAVATVLMDRAIALWGLVWFVAILGSVFWMCGMLEGDGVEPAKYIVTSAATIVGASVVVWLLLGLLPQHRAERFAGRLSRLPKIGGSAAEFWRAVWMYRCRQGSVALALLLAWIGHVGFVLAFYCSARTLCDGGEGNLIPTLTQHFLIVPIGLVIAATPLFPGGAGIGEMGYGGLYQLFGRASANGILGSLVQRVITWVVGILGYLVYLRMRAVPQPSQQAPPVALEKQERVAAESLSWRHPQPENLPAS
jgi:glycosyltransferase 2 family protein